MNCQGICLTVTNLGPEPGPRASEVAFLMVLKSHGLLRMDVVQIKVMGMNICFLPEGNRIKDSEVISLFDTYFLSLELIL